MKTKIKAPVKALVLFSGGLDSRLVVKLLQQQKTPKLEVELIYFKLPFGCGCCNSIECNFNFSQTEGAKLTVLDCTKSPLFEEYLDIVKHPKFGRGSSMNPCIDCKIFMFKKAKEYADKQNPKINIIATGEVLGERPMSQTSGSLRKIDREIGFELLRPLSAKLLPETQAEKSGLIERENLLGLSGRSRKTQLEMAKKFNIKFPAPAGGCLLCEKSYKPKLKDLFINSRNRKISPELLSTLANFRHFRNRKTGGKILLGKNHGENLLLEQLNKRLNYHILLSPETLPGPTALYEKAEDKKLAEEMVKVYSGKNLEERKKFDKIRV